MKPLSYYLSNPKALLIDANKSKEELLEVNLNTHNACKSSDFNSFKTIGCSGISCRNCPFYDAHTITTFISSIDIHRASNGKLYEYRISKSGNKYRKYFK